MTKLATVRWIDERPAGPLFWGSQFVQRHFQCSLKSFYGNDLSPSDGWIKRSARWPNSTQCDELMNGPLGHFSEVAVLSRGILSVTSNCFAKIDLSSSRCWIKHRTLVKILYVVGPITRILSRCPDFMCTCLYTSSFVQFFSATLNLTDIDNPVSFFFLGSSHTKILIKALIYFWSSAKNYKLLWRLISA